MAKIAKLTEIKTSSQKETLMDKTTRIVREIQDGEAKQREIKTIRLRNSRLESKAVEAIAATSSKARKKPLPETLK